MIGCPQFHLSLESFSFDSNVPNTQVQRMWSLNILDKALPILPLSTAKNCYDDGNSQHLFKSSKVEILRETPSLSSVPEISLQVRSQLCRKD